MTQSIRNFWFAVVLALAVAITLVIAIMPATVHGEVNIAAHNGPKWRTVLSDDFNDGILDSSLWRTDTSWGNVTEVNGHVELYARGFLITKEQFNPHDYEAIKVTGQWTFAYSYWEDIMTVVTRSDGMRGDMYGGIKNGVAFGARSLTPNNTDVDNWMVIQLIREGQPETIARVTIGRYDIVIGDVFNFEVIDDGEHVTWSMSKVGSDGTKLFIKADVSAIFATNHIVFYNREFPYTSYLDNVQISVLEKSPAAVPCGDLRCSIIGAGDEDMIIGTAGDDVICGTDKADVILGKGGHDTICAGAGDDIVLAGAGHDRVYGGAGADLIHGGPGIDVLEGQDQADVLLGGIDNDVLFGGYGRDCLSGGAGVNLVNGGPGRDSCEAGNRSTAINCEVAAMLACLDLLRLKPELRTKPELMQLLNESK
jgi:hypothetical protein